MQSLASLNRATPKASSHKILPTKV
jgi:hypothetical protein